MLHKINTLTMTERRSDGQTDNLKLLMNHHMYKILYKILKGGVVKYKILII